MDLIHKISKLNMTERELLISHSSYLDQERELRIRFKDGIDIELNQLYYCIKLSTAVKLDFQRFNFIDQIIFESIIKQYSFKLGNVY